MIEVRRYLDKDFSQVSEWAKAYGAEYQDHQFPKTGFIVDGVAAYFMYSTDSSVCFLENLIANPEACPVQKDQAINSIIEAILSEAREKGFRVAYATTNIPTVVFRAITHGATAEPRQTLLVKKLTSPSNDG